MADSSGSGINIDPMGQFLIKPLFGGDLGPITFTNSSLWMAIVVTGAVLLFVIGSQGRALVPTRLQSMTEVLYEFIQNMVRDTTGSDGLKYFPYIFTLFIFIVFSNVFGLIPYSFTVTSHLAVTATLAIAVFATVVGIGFYKHGLGFLKLFVPGNCPPLLLPILLPIEVISFLVRPVSHSIRLGGNMLAGHAVMKVFAGFVAPLSFAGVVPLVFMVALYGLELLVAVIQAYIFTILTCIYLKDALHPHH